MLDAESSIQHPVFSVEHLAHFSGDNSGGETPVTIPNTVVKPSSADGTSRVTSWESRTLPGIFLGLLKSRPFLLAESRY